MTILASLGTHYSEEYKIKFFEKIESGSSSLGANVYQLPERNLIGKFLPVKDLCYEHKESLVSLKTRIERLLRNCLVTSLYQPEEKEVQIIPHPVPITSWIELQQAELPLHSLSCIRSDGTISYAYFNTVKTWDWRSNTWSHTSYPLREITALVEDQEGHLCIGDNKGSLYLQNELISSIIQGKLKDIKRLSTDHYLIQFYQELGPSDHSDYPGYIDDFKIIDLKKKQLILGVKFNQPLVRKDGIIIDFNQETSTLFRYVFQGETYQSQEILQLNQKIKAIRHAEGNTIAIWIQDTHAVIFFDIKTGVQTSIHHPRFNEDYLNSDFHTLLNQDKLTYIPRKKEHLILYPKMNNSSTDIFLQGNKWGVRSVTVLSNGLVVCGTQSSGAGIYTVDSKKDVYIIKDQLDQSVEWCQELANGYLAIFLQTQIKIFRPHFKGKKESSSFKDKPFQDQTHLLGLEMAAKLSLPQEEVIYKKKLFIGEGTFSFTEALLDKHQKTHPGLRYVITATEFGYPVDDEAVYTRIDNLQKQGVSIFFGIDGTKIDQEFRGKRFQRIHWNCPFGESANEKVEEAFKKVIPDFFKAASSLQLTKDRIHVTLVQPTNSDWKRIRQLQNPIVKGATEANYRLIRKRQFSQERYPKYQHNNTGTTVSNIGEQPKREFVFEKVGQPEKGLHPYMLKDPLQKEYTINKESNKDDSPENYYFECSTDEDSSDYYDSDTEF
ncbi:Rossmann-like fold-containing protein [Rhabdochlamydiaceae symbiont of Dictyostelium giganteum]|uniref:Rossmann-like fold-containing protein n=1 Tax=Rhabdochlamydiaceae symbiont of Dictyostelium giganteum TaxID=3342349 RepID=UPI00384B464E